MRRHLGLITRAKLLEFGVSGSTVDGWVTRGELEILERGVYRLPGTASTAAQRLLATVFRAGEGARLTGWSACGLYGLEGFDPFARPWVVIPAARRVRGVDFIVERMDLERCDLATVSGLPAVMPTRALIDAAFRVAAKPVRVGIDDARRRRMVNLDRLQARAVELGRPVVRSRSGASSVRVCSIRMANSSAGSHSRSLPSVSGPRGAWRYCPASLSTRASPRPRR